MRHVSLRSRPASTQEASSVRSDQRVPAWSASTIPALARQYRLLLVTIYGGMDKHYHLQSWCFQG